MSLKKNWTIKMEVPVLYFFKNSDVFFIWLNDLGRKTRFKSDEDKKR